MPLKIRLFGDQKVAATFIRQGKKELLRTKELRDKMGVPTYQRIIQVDPFTTIKVLLEKEQEIVFIKSIVPEGMEHLAEGEKEEEEVSSCEPAFIVYKNTKADVNNPIKEGHKITYKGRRWQLEEVPSTEKNAGTAAWYHIRDNLAKYYNKSGLKECDLISWRGNKGGAGFHTGDTAFNTYRTAAFFVGGKTQDNKAGAGQEILGVCLLPNTQDKKDYFYTLSYRRFDETSARGTDFYVQRFDRDPLLLAPIGFATQVLRITAADIAAAVGSTSSVTFRRPPYCAYIDPNGNATLSFAALFAFSDGETHKFVFGDPNMYIANTPVAPYFPIILRINILSATWTAEVAAQLSAPKVTITDKESTVDQSIIGLAGYGQISLSVTSGPFNPGVVGENDYLRTVGTPGVNVHVEYKASLHNRRPDLSGYARYSTSPTATTLMVYGGCDALYEYKLRVVDTGTESILSAASDVFFVPNKDFTSLPDSMPTIPVYLHEIDRQQGITQYYQEVFVTKNGNELPWKFRILEFGMDGFHTHHSKAKVRGSSNAGTNISDLVGTRDSQSFNYQSESTVFDYTDTIFSGNCKYTPTYATVNTYLIHRALLFHHPQIPDLYTYSERRITYGAGSPQITVSISYHVVEKGKNTEVWETARAFPVSGSTGSGKFIQLRRWIESFAPGTTGAFEHQSKFNREFEFSVPLPLSNEIGPIAMPIAQSLDRYFDYPPFGTSAGSLSAFGRLKIGVLNYDVTSIRTSAAHKRTLCAVHHKNFGPDIGDAHPYLLYLIHPQLPPGTLNDAAFLASEWDAVSLDGNLDTAFYLPLQDDQATITGTFYSNIMTLAQLKKLTKETSDSPVDFGVI